MNFQEKIEVKKSERLKRKYTVKTHSFQSKLSELNDERKKANGTNKQNKQTIIRTKSVY